MKKIIIFSLILIFVTAFCSCSNSSLSSTDDKPLVIKMIVKKYDHAFWSVVKMGADAAAKEFNVIVEFDGPTDEEDIDGQIRMVEAAIDNKVDALVLAASDYNKLVPVTEKAKKTGIPIIIIDSNINSKNIDSFIGTDNIDAGKKLGESLVNVVGTNCDIAIVSFVKGAASATEREVGLENTLSLYPDINVLSKIYCNSDEKIAQQLTTELINEFPQIDAFVCLNAYGTVGTARSVVALNKENIIKIIGFDSTPSEITYLENDVIQSLVIQNPFSMGYLGVKYAIDKINHLSIPKIVKTPSTVINKQNMYLPENQKLVFPFVN